MRTYDELFVDAADRAAFANGSEGEAWTAAWCERCTRDDLADVDGGCPLLLVALMGRTPVEFVPGPTDAAGRVSLTQQYRCTEFDPISPT